MIITIEADRYFHITGQSPTEIEDTLPRTEKDFHAGAGGPLVPRAANGIPKSVLATDFGISRETE